MHWQNLVNYGILPLSFKDKADYERVRHDDVLRIRNPGEQLQQAAEIPAENVTQSRSFFTYHQLSDRQIIILLQGGLINWCKHHLSGNTATI